MSEFATHLHEVFAELGPITVRRMFGGHGVYHQGLMFGLVSGDALYLKTDSETLPRFAARKLPPFRYSRQGKVLSLSYHQAPDEVLEDPDAAAEWGRAALGAALRAQQAGPKIKASKKATKKTTRKVSKNVTKQAPA